MGRLRMGCVIALMVMGGALSACSDTLAKIEGGLGATTISSTQVQVAVNSFDTAEVAVTPYIAYCTAKPQPKGCSATVLASLHDYIVNKGRPARKALEQWAAGNSGTGDITTLYNTLTSATSAINTIAQQNGIKS